MRSFFGSLSVVLLLIALPLQAYDDGDPKILMSLGGTYTNPVRLSEEGYNPTGGFMGRIGLAGYEDKGFFGNVIFIGGESNAMKLKSSSARVNVYDIYMGGESDLFIFKFGGTFGGLRLSMPGDDFRENGNSTMTELGSENRKIQKCESFLIGARLPFLFLDNDFFNHFILDYEYRSISADRAWLVWHDCVSTLIILTGFGVLEKISGALSRKGYRVAPLIISCLEAGAFALTWYYDYEYHNMPWQDEKPFRFHRHLFSLSFVI